MNFQNILLENFGIVTYNVIYYKFYFLKRKQQRKFHKISKILSKTICGFLAYFSTILD